MSTVSIRSEHSSPFMNVTFFYGYISLYGLSMGKLRHSLKFSLCLPYCMSMVHITESIAISRSILLTLYVNLHGYLCISDYSTLTRLYIRRASNSETGAVHLLSSPITHSTYVWINIYMSWPSKLRPHELKKMVHRNDFISQRFAFGEQ